MKSVITDRKKECSICDNRDLVEILSLPKFPLTGIYVDDSSDGRFQPVDQSLLYCPKCKHAQLMNLLDPSFLYQETYTHRSSLSPIARRGNDFFVAFLQNALKGRTFERILEIGCNDLYMLKNLSGFGQKLYGLDPIWKGRENEADTGGTLKVIGKFVEEIDAQSDLGGQPDLIVSSHTFEHVPDPKKALKYLMEIAAPGAVFAVEVPGFDTLVEINRFDQVFHQHIHYYSLSSFSALIQELGGTYLDHTFNYDYWGGTMLVLFRKGKEGSNRFEAPALSESKIRESFKRFQRQLSACGEAVESQKSGPIYGYGAAQMLPTLAYHLKSDFSWCKAVLDDEPRREGKMFPGLPVKIEKPAPDFTLKDATAVITALDSARPILQRVIALKAKRIIAPLSIL